MQFIFGMWDFVKTKMETLCEKRKHIAKNANTLQKTQTALKSSKTDIKWHKVERAHVANVGDLLIQVLTTANGKWAWQLGNHIYYERGFELFRSAYARKMHHTLKSIKSLGLAITDHSFDFANLKPKFKRLKKIPKDFGFYHNFQIWQRTIS